MMRFGERRWTAALGLAFGLALAGGGATPAAAVPIDTSTMFVLPIVGESPAAPLVQLNDDDFVRVRGTDAALAVTATKVSPGGLNTASPANALMYTWTAEFTWNGTVNNGQAPPVGLQPFLLFTIADDRWGPSILTGVTINGGFNNFGGDVLEGPFLFEDPNDDFDLQGLFSDVSLDRWVGVKIPLAQGVEYTITADWYLGQDVTSIPGFPNNGTNGFRFAVIPFVSFVPVPTPEPGTVLLVVTGVLGVAALRRRPRA